MNKSINAFELSDTAIRLVDAYSTPDEIITVVSTTYQKANKAIDTNFVLTADNSECLFHVLNYTVDRIELSSPRGSWESNTKQEKRQAIYNAMQRFLKKNGIV